MNKEVNNTQTGGVLLGENEAYGADQAAGEARSEAVGQQDAVRSRQSQAEAYSGTVKIAWQNRDNLPYA